MPGSSAENVQPPAQKEAAKSEGTSVNLLVNGDFEIPLLPGDGSSGTEFWRDQPGYPVRAVVEQTPSAHSGRQALKLSPAGPGTSGVAAQFARLIEGAEKHVFECYARGPGARLGLVIYSWGGEEIMEMPQRVVETQDSEIFSLGPEWKLCRMEYKPAKKNFMYVTVAFHLVAGEAEVDDARLLAVGGKAETYGKYEERPWRGNRLGLSHSVPPPFVPVRVSPAGDETQALTTAGPLAGPFVLSCWGRAYRFTQGPLPAEMDSTGESLLARPVTFRVSADGGAAAAMEWRGLEMKDCQPDVVKFACDGVVDVGGEKKLNLSVETTLEFDGMLRYDVTLQPKEAVTLKEFSLEIPFRREAAKLFHWQVVDFTESTWHDRSHWEAVPSQPWHSTFSPTIWLGDQDRGLCWFAEAPRGWGNKGAEDRQVEIVPWPDSLLLRINFINVPTRVNAQRTWTFGLLATPAKPVPAFAANQNVMTNGNDNPAAAIEYLLLPDHLVGDLPGGDPLEYYIQPKNKESMRDAVRRAHAHKHLIMPWMQGQIVEMLPGYIEKVSQWMQRPVLTFRGRGQWVCYCQGSEGWTDLLLYSLVQLVKEYGFDGVYFDTGFSGNGCENPAHGCGYLDGEGRWRPSFPYFAGHEFKKRLYRALYEAMGRQPYISSLLNGIYDFAVGTFDTAIVSGEEWNITVSDDYRVVASLPQWEAQYNPTPWGVWGLFLPSNAARQTLATTNSFLAFALLEHTPLWMSAGDMKLMLAALGAIDKLGPEARFVPRWESDKYIRPSSSQCPASLYMAKEEAVIVLSNFGNTAVETSVLCDTQALGWKTSAGRAADALTGAALNVSGNRIAVTVPANGFVMVRVSPGA